MKSRNYSKNSYDQAFLTNPTNSNALGKPLDGFVNFLDEAQK